jgi:GT2 family glycosyltransferase
MANIIPILIPTFNNQDQLLACIKSIEQNTDSNYHIFVINNGTPLKPWASKDITYLETGSNLGWHLGLNFGIEHLKSIKAEYSYFVCMNDDTLVLPGKDKWLEKMKDIMVKDGCVAAVGPSSTCVSGIASIFCDCPAFRIETGFLIGFCTVVRKEAYDKVGGFDLNPAMLPDDMDMSIRYTDAGYKLVIARDVFVFHHGFQTGRKIRADWGSPEMSVETNKLLIAKHGQEKFDRLFRENKIYGGK